jgi:anaerobic ribonucleoside-triphosphate reductase activating protein
MMVRISRVHFPLTVLGPGRRLGIWLQGCHVACPGCVSRDTWDPLGGTLVGVEELVAQCRALAGDVLDGITISGGEPFEQADALAALLDSLGDWRIAAGLDILCYSGLPLKTLRRDHARLLGRLDALIPEPFIARRPTGARWRGSANQSLVVLSPLGQQRYVESLPAAPAMQVSVTDRAVWFVGIPRRGDLDRLASIAAAGGLTLEDVSWTL